MMWSVEVDQDTCVGSGMCNAAAPELFLLEGSTSVALRPTAEPAEDVRDAAESCPVEAITIRDTDTGAIEAPTDT
ncbi:ferredoxin [Allosaccharopolyspora coralli]|uniref:Ferredoxin n=1 Tax=Allosaccharopolyspora coralli TaxID=2665642 RepID=A0A5Q3Q5V7_9PSEU|nr:ferredoxin [Allosaccharopolyspora coralli]QGK69220.1 ferredoxin [Allosaccharopolyspora coralli]